MRGELTNFDQLIGEHSYRGDKHGSVQGLLRVKETPVQHRSCCKVAFHLFNNENLQPWQKSAKKRPTAFILGLCFRPCFSTRGLQQYLLLSTIFQNNNTRQAVHKPCTKRPVPTQPRALHLEELSHLCESLEAPALPNACTDIIVNKLMMPKI